VNVALWIVRVLLAMAFLAHGLLFLTPPPDIAAMMNASLPRWFQIFLGIAEILAAVGLTLPGLTRIMPSLVGWAAVGIVLVMVSAIPYHLMRGEVSSAMINFVLLAMAAWVAYARFRVLPIRRRIPAGRRGGVVTP
jgi:putative oxidoreductase